MDLELDDDQQVLRSSARELLDAICPPALVRDERWDELTATARAFLAEAVGR